MRVMGPEREVLENRERGRKPGEQGMGKEAWGTGSREGSLENKEWGRGRRICTFSNMMSWRTTGSYFG